MKMPAQFVVRFRLQNCVCLFVGEPSRATDGGFCKARTFCAPVLVELDKNRMREPVHPRIETANTVAQSLRQHWDHAIGQVNAVATALSFAVECAIWSYVGGNVRNVHSKSPAAEGFRARSVFDLLHVNGVIEIASVIRID